MKNYPSATQSQIQPHDIDATLEGNTYTSKWLHTLAVALLVFTSVCATALAIAAIGMRLTGERLFDDFTAAICGMTFFIFIAGEIFLIVFLNRKKKTVGEWLKDAIVVDAAHVKTPDTTYTRRFGIAVRVEFKLYSKRIIRKSERKGVHVYSYVYFKYADRDITVAYSPRYDKEMFIKAAPIHPSEQA